MRRARNATAARFGAAVVVVGGAGPEAEVLGGSVFVRPDVEALVAVGAVSRSSDPHAPSAITMSTSMLLVNWARSRDIE
jgi:hypothetical protein